MRVRANANQQDIRWMRLLAVHILPSGQSATQGKTIGVLSGRLAAHLQLFNFFISSGFLISFKALHGFSKGPERVSFQICC